MPARLAEPRAEAVLEHVPLTARGVPSAQDHWLTKPASSRPGFLRPVSARHGHTSGIYAWAGRVACKPSPLHRELLACGCMAHAGYGSLQAEVSKA